MSDTPRTNAFEHNMGSVVEPHYVVDVEVAQGLERELAAAIASFNEERERAQREGARVIELQVKLAEAVAAERKRCAKVCEERGSFNSMYAHHILTGAAAAIRKGEKESLTVAVQERMHPEIKKMYEDYFDKCFRESSTQQRPWVGLTGTEINHIFARNVGYPERMMKEVETLLKDKNT